MKKALKLVIIAGVMFTFAAGIFSDLHARGSMGGFRQGAMMGQAQPRGPMYQQNQENVQMQQTNRTMQQKRERKRIHTPGTGLGNQRGNS
ncbi:MAG: hypothetical protein ABWJ99_05485 [Caldimicrobium sp.]